MPSRRRRPRISKSLVIDATVVQGAGGEDAVHPTSKNCRAFLMDVLDICHHAVLTSEVGDEWKRHRSRFSSTWLYSMNAKKKIDYPDNPTNDTLRSAVGRAIAKDKAREAALKDVHLIEAALVTDKTVVSLDEIARNLFKGAAVSVTTIRDIMWVNPDKQHEEVSAWLKSGAEPESSRLLGHTDKN